MPKTVDYFLFWITDELSGKRRRLKFEMSREIALERYGDDAVADERTRNARLVYGPEEDPPANSLPPR